MDAIALRPLRHGERKPVLDVFAGLSERSRRLRFLGSKPRLPERDVDWLVDVGCCGREAVVAIDEATGRTVGLARFVRDADAPEAEIAFESSTSGRAAASAGSCSTSCGRWRSSRASSASGR